MPYVIRRIPDGKYVAQPGSKNSYTRSQDRARVFETREAAERELCVDNETIVSICRC